MYTIYMMMWDNFLAVWMFNRSFSLIEGMVFTHKKITRNYLKQDGSREKGRSNRKLKISKVRIPVGKIVSYFIEMFRNWSSFKFQNWIFQNCVLLSLYIHLVLMMAIQDDDRKICSSTLNIYNMMMMIIFFFLAWFQWI